MEGLGYYTLTLRFGLNDQDLMGRYQVNFLTDLDVGLQQVIEYFEKVPFVSEVSFNSLIANGWLFVVSPHARDIRWTFLSPVINEYMLRTWDPETINLYLKTAEKEYGMLPEPLAWFAAQQDLNGQLDTSTSSDTNRVS